jgi:dienelactone hydrolase
MPAHSLPVLLVVLALAAGGAKAQPSEVLDVPSLTLTTEQFLAGDASGGEPVTLTGRLRLPDGEPPYPAVVLLHGSDGPHGGAVARWKGVIPTLGVATFTLDSFTTRGLAELATDQSRLSPFAQIFDAYRAVEAIAADPRIDPDRIAVMGFSRGGIAALYSAMTRFQQSFGPRQGRIAAHLPFYPACDFGLAGELDVADAPIREFHGGADDYTLPGPCRDYIGRLAAAGHDATMTEYPGVLHGFDDHEGPRWVDATLPSARRCPRVERDGVLVVEATGLPFTWDASCVEYRVTGGYDEAATAAARAEVAAFLRGVFSLP